MTTDIESCVQLSHPQQSLDEHVKFDDIEHEKLRRVPDRLPRIALLILAVEVS